MGFTEEEIATWAEVRQLVKEHPYLYLPEAVRFQQGLYSQKLWKRAPVRLGKPDILRPRELSDK